MWFVLGPAATLLASSALFAVDAVARHWQLSDGRRLALALVGALGVGNVVAGWGHPEDCVALAFVVWAALAMERRGLAGAPRAALLLGLGIAFQPLAILGVVPVLCRLDWRDAPAVWRGACVAPSLCVLLLAPVLAEAHETLTVLVRQPFEPKFVSFTPLTHLAPVIGPGTDGGGPTRLLATVLSMALALAVCRRRHDLQTVLAVTAAAFFLRVLLETELNWYYLWPVPALCLLLSMRRGSARFALCTAAFVLSVILGNHDEVHRIGLWWPALMGTLVVMMLTAIPAARPGAGARRRVRGHGDGGGRHGPGGELKGLRDDVYRRPLATALERLGLAGGWRCVDVGAGGGDVSVALAEMVGRDGRVYAVDSDPRTRDEVARAAAAHAQVIALTQAGEDLSLPEEVDLAFCRFLLLHVLEPLAVVRMMAAAVRPGGWVVAQEPITTAGRIAGAPFSMPGARHPDVGALLPALVREVGLEVIDAWAEAPAGVGPGPVSALSRDAHRGRSGRGSGRPATAGHGDRPPGLREGARRASR